MTAARVIRLIGRFLLVWFISALGLWLVTLILPEVQLSPSGYPWVFVSALLASLALFLGNAILRPLLLFVARPISVATFGLFTLFISGVVFAVVAGLTSLLEVTNVWYGILAVILLAIINGAIMSLIGLEDSESFWSTLARRQSRRLAKRDADGGGRGVLLLEIDGLSHTLAQRAVEEGKLPTMSRMLREGTHVLSPYDCGLPSQTSACQAGIMYGDNWDIPAFRWYDKAEARVISSSNFDDALAMDQAHRSGKGLLRDGAGVNNHASGDASRMLFVLSAMKAPRDKATKRDAARELNRFFQDPYLFPRSLVLTFLDVINEVAQATWARLTDRQPRIKRIHGPYPLVRGATNVLLRNLSTFVVANEVVRGAPAIYTTYVGYDEVAHHAGPATADALRTLKGLDQQFKRILKVLHTWAGRPYDLFILSDHGQSQGATFKQRYGETLGDLFQRLVGQGREVTEVDATEHSSGQTRAFLAQVQEGQAQKRGRAADRAGVAGQGSDGATPGSGDASTGSRSTSSGAAESDIDAAKPSGAVASGAAAMRRRLDKLEPAQAMTSPVVACCSGNLANVYFDISKDRVTIEQLEEAYPGLLDETVRHEGVGLVVATDDGGRRWAIGAGGRRDLADGRVEGEDPLAQYAPHPAWDDEAEPRAAAQLARLADMPHAGDLIVVSTVYEDGSVAAFEELVGNHGGLGGLQTEAFILHPADMPAPRTSNSEEIFPLIDARRGRPA